MSTAPNVSPAHLRAVADLVEANPDLPPISVGLFIGTQAYATTRADAVALVRAIGGTWELKRYPMDSSRVRIEGQFNGQSFEIAMPSTEAFDVVPKQLQLASELAEVVSEG